MGSTNFSTPADALAHKAITWNYGNFITLVINFVIVAFCIFLVVKAVNQDEAPGPERRAGVKRLSGVRDDYSRSRRHVVLIALLNSRKRPRINAGSSTLLCASKLTLSFRRSHST